jgi:hypothetical protein
MLRAGEPLLESLREQDGPGLRGTNPAKRQKRSDPIDYPREKPKNPKGNSTGPLCLATGQFDHREAHLSKRNLGENFATRREVRISLENPWIFTLFFLAGS